MGALQARELLDTHKLASLLVPLPTRDLPLLGPLPPLAQILPLKMLMLTLPVVGAFDLTIPDTDGDTAKVMALVIVPTSPLDVAITAIPMLGLDPPPEMVLLRTDELPIHSVTCIAVTPTRVRPEEEEDAPLKTCAPMMVTKVDPVLGKLLGGGRVRLGASMDKAADRVPTTPTATAGLTVVTAITGERAPRETKPGVLVAMQEDDVQDVTWAAAVEPTRASTDDDEEEEDEEVENRNRP